MKKSGSHGTIQHAGTVKQVEGDSVLVSIVSSSACSGCHAEGVCNISGKEEKIISVKGRYNVLPGDNVTVEMNESMGMKAVVLSYIIPVFIIFAGLVVFSSLSMSEAASGLASISLLLPYFIILYIFRRNINRSFSFSLKT
ncbi:MAG TPA: SoxR reducing system RseC family protein [Bacteroidales bacterium]|jgi:sigma-E factor negative regulatory protein RseC|nr:SoxR reducing system RseC family protein [Bacteroidales bacterium]